MLSFVAALLLKLFAFHISTPGLYEGCMEFKICLTSLLFLTKNIYHERPKSAIFLQL